MWVAIGEKKYAEKVCNVEPDSRRRTGTAVCEPTTFGPGTAVSSDSSSPRDWVAGRVESMHIFLGSRCEESLLDPTNHCRTHFAP